MRADPGGLFVPDAMGLTPVHIALLIEDVPEIYDLLISGVVNETDLRALNTPAIQHICRLRNMRNRIEDTMRERGINPEAQQESEGDSSE
jgi:hypothetical protein